METTTSTLIPRKAYARDFYVEALIKLVDRFEQALLRLEDLEDKFDRQRRPYGDGTRLQRIARR
jgi:hypothetical protein